MASVDQDAKYAKIKEEFEAKASPELATKVELRPVYRRGKLTSIVVRRRIKAAS